MRTYIRVRGNRGDEVSGEVVREQPLLNAEAAGPRG